MFLTLAMVLVSQATPEAFGAVGDCLASDDTTPVEKAILAAAESKFDKRVILLNCYNMSRQLVVPSTVRIIGSIGRNGSRLQFARKIAGVKILHSAPFTTIENLAIASTIHPDDAGIVDKHGITIQASGVDIRRVMVDGFPGNGIEMDCRVGLGTDCSITSVSASRLEQNRAWGIHTNGGDTNGSTFSGVSMADNSKGCVFEESFLGNAYLGGHCDSSQQYMSGAKSFMQMDPSAATTIVGMYFEGPGEIHLESLSASVIGGNPGLLTGRGMMVARGRIRNAKWEGPLPLAAQYAGAHVLDLQGYNQTAWPMYLDYEFSELNAWELQIANSQLAFTIGTFGNAELAPSQIAFPHPIAFGPKGQRRTVYYSSGKPNGVCKGGDVRFNNDISVSNRCSLYVCDRGTWACGASLPQ